MAYLGDGHTWVTYLIEVLNGPRLRMVDQSLWPNEELRNRCLEITKTVQNYVYGKYDQGVKDVDVIATDVWVSMAKMPLFGQNALLYSNHIKLMHALCL